MAHYTIYQDGHVLDDVEIVVDVDGIIYARSNLHGNAARIPPTSSLHNLLRDMPAEQQAYHIYGSLLSSRELYPPNLWYDANIDEKIEEIKNA